jgi:cell division transport system permease protein
LKIKSVSYYFKEAFQDMRHNKSMLLASVGITLVMFVIMGFFFLFTSNLNYMIKDEEQKLQITAFLRDDIETERIQAIEQELSEIEGVRRVYFVSNQEALERLSERLGKRKGLLTGYEEDNPLRHSFEIYVKKSNEVPQIAQVTETIRDIAEVRFGRDEVEKLTRLSTSLRIGMFFLAVGLSASSLLVLMNTIRLTIDARGEEIQIMKYVGASDWFIRWPFLLQGMILGLLGALIAGLILLALYSRLYAYVIREIPFLPMLPANPHLFNLIQIIALGGLAIGFFGSMISLGKYLKV